MLVSLATLAEIMAYYRRDANVHPAPPLSASRAGYPVHSLRVGGAQSLAAGGASLVEMQTAGRWQSPAMPGHYARGTRPRTYFNLKYGVSPASNPFSFSPIGTGGFFKLVDHDQPHRGRGCRRYRWKQRGKERQKRAVLGVYTEAGGGPRSTRARGFRNFQMSTVRHLANIRPLSLPAPRPVSGSSQGMHALGAVRLSRGSRL